MFRFGKILWVVWTCLVPLALVAETAEEKGMRIAKEMEEANRGFIGEMAQVEMLLINAHGDKTTRKMKSLVLERDKEGDLSINEFLWPADVKGTKLLTHAYKEKDDEQWLYMPAVKRVKRISSRNKSGSFMGSEFSYEDMGSQEPEKYRFKYLEETTLEGRKVHKMERYPVDPNTSYAKQIVFQDLEYKAVLRLEYFDKKSELLKVAEFSGHKKLYKNIYRPSQIHMKNVQTKKESILSWKKRKLGAKLSTASFQSTKLAGDDF